MGLFSSIGKIFGKVAPIASSLSGQPWLGAAIGAASSAYQGSQDRAQAQKQMQFQQGMSDTSYQRAMLDMQRAGLNPILAYKQGGASTPGGAMARSPDIGRGALQGASAMASLQNIKQQNSNLNAQEALTKQQALRLNLENSAYSQLSPNMRLLYMSQNPALAGVSMTGKAFSKVAPVAKSFFNRLPSASYKNVVPNLKRYGSAFRNYIKKGN